MDRGRVLLAAITASLLGFVLTGSVPPTALGAEGKIKIDKLADLPPHTFEV